MGQNSTAIQFYESIIKSLDGLIYICSRDYKIQFMNDFFIKRLGRNAVGEYCYKAFHDFDEKCSWCVNDRVFDGESVGWEFKSKRDDRWYYSSDSLIHDSLGNPMKLSFIQDITERKRLELMLKREAYEGSVFQKAQVELLKKDLSDFSSALDLLLRESAKALGIERISYWTFDEKCTQINCCRRYSLSHDEFYSDETTIDIKIFPKYFAALNEQRIIVTSNAQECELTSEFKTDYLVPLGITSMLDVPIWHRGKRVGIICHEHIGPVRQWSFSEKDFCRFIAEMLTLSIEMVLKQQLADELKESKHRLEFAISGADLGLWEWNLERHIIRLSGQSARLFEGNSEEVDIEKTDWENLIHEEDRKLRQKNLESYFAGTSSFYEAEYRISSRSYAGSDNKWIWLLERGRVADYNPLTNKPSRFFGTHLDITARKMSEKIIKDNLHEKETLLREIHHRVKNNLQLISSLLMLQSHYAKDEAVKSVLNVAESRIQSIAFVHEKLHQSKGLTQFDVSEYVEKIIEHYQQFFKDLGNRITIVTDIQNMFFTIDTAVPVGFIISELIMNCFKHAFPDNRLGQIKIALKQINKAEYMLEVSDNGVGFSAPLRGTINQSLGFELISIFASQLDGSYKKTSEQGVTSVQVKFFDKASLKVTQP